MRAEQVKPDAGDVRQTGSDSELFIETAKTETLNSQTEQVA